MLRAVAGLLAWQLAGAAVVSAQGGERLFYYSDNESSYNSLVAHIDRIDVVAPSAYNVDANGVVYGSVDSRVITLAKGHGVKVVPLLVNRGFDQAKLHTLLASPEVRARMVASMVELCRRHGYAGFQIDFENLSIDDRELFTTFYREAAAALRAGGFGISVAVVHRPDELAGPSAYHEWLFDSWRGGYDLKALAEAGDFISVMSYSQHTRRTPPGPQAGVPWMQDIIRHFLRYVPAEKLSLGIATGSQRWFTSYDERIQPELARSYSEQLTHAWALGHLERNGARVQWDDEQKVTFGYYAAGGTFEWIFLEDARSFRARLALVDQHRLRGFSVWVLGPEDPAIWEALPRRARGT